MRVVKQGVMPWTMIRYILYYYYTYYTRERKSERERERFLFPSKTCFSKRDPIRNELVFFHFFKVFFHCLTSNLAINYYDLTSTIKSSSPSLQHTAKYNYSSTNPSPPTATINRSRR